MSAALNGYMAFFGPKRAEIRASDMFDAQKQAIAHFKAPAKQAHRVTVILCERAGEQVEAALV